jgi:hypothetical protein
LIALAVYNVVLFFPVAYMGRVVSPNDIYFNYEPWKTVRPAEVQAAQNSTLNDPATAYLTLMTMVRDDWRTFHWNPYVGSGIPGFGSSAAATLSPFILLPALAVPQAWVYTAILFLKLNASFVFAYLWLREERLGRRGAAIGAIVIAGAGVYSVRWLWQITNATALYPALLWIVRRTFNGKRTSIAIVTPIALAYALSGFPAAMAYGAWVVVAYALYLLVRAFVERNRARRSVRWPGSMRLVAPVAGVVLGVLIALPSLVPFAQLLKRSGYLEVREKASLAGVFPATHWRSLIEPDRLGHHAYKNWLGDPRLGALNNYPESTIYVGLLTLPLLLLAIFNRRARQRWFWLVCGALVVACMFGAPLLAPFVATLPGFKFSALGRLALLLPIPAGYLAAAGARLLRKPLLMYGAVAIVAFDLALLAGRFYPYLEPRTAAVPVTPMMEFVRTEKGPFRVAPFFDYFWPNTAELVRFEDVRSHFGSELAYRRMLLRLDPTAWSGSSTVLTFNSLQFKFDDPLAALLGIRWYIEQKDIDIIRWALFSATKPAVQEISGWVALPNGVALQRTVRIDAEPFWSIELPVRIDDAEPSGRIDVTLSKSGAPVWSRAFSRNDVTALGKVYIPVRPYARLGEQVTLRARGSGVNAFLLEGANDVAGEARIFYGRVTIPIMFDRELPDGRLFRNVGELPRFRAVSKLRKLNDDEFLAARDIDFATEAVITDDPVMPPALGPANAQVTLASYAAGEQRVLTQSDAPFFLASSEKLTPELRVTLDGREVRAIETDSIFAGVQVPAGKHELVFSRRIARGWWWVAIAALAMWVAIAISETLVERRALARR